MKLITYIGQSIAAIAAVCAAAAGVAFTIAVAFLVFTWPFWVAVAAIKIIFF